MKLGFRPLAPAAMASTLDLDKGCTVEELLRGCIEAFGELPAALGNTQLDPEPDSRPEPTQAPILKSSYEKLLDFAEKCPNVPPCQGRGPGVPTLTWEGHYLSPWGIRRNSLSLAWELFPADGGWFIG